MSGFSYRDGRFFKDGEPFYFRGAEYMYYRDKRSNWADRLDQIKAADVNVVCFYTPWRHHLVHDCETGAVGYDFTGETLDSRDLVTFLDLCAEKGLWMLAKPGPFIHSELNIGGLPDLTSPSFNPSIEPVRLHDGTPLFWEYDNTQLPSPNDPVYDRLVKDWMGEVAAVLDPHVAPRGNIIAIQLNDETMYCTSNDAPWHFGYDAPDMAHFHRMLERKYGTIVAYNRLHGTDFRAFAFVPAIRPDPRRPEAATTAGLLSLVDWGEFQWRIRREFYARYRDYLGIDLPYLTNFAGITPPIEENVPDAQAEPTRDTPDEFVSLYADWWLAQNRVDRDLDVHEYGMISWLGVASYNIGDASSEPGELGDNEVFNRYINTARRRRGINIEENWGFSKLYHPLSRYPMIPFFQTLASVAGGCTGYVVFTSVCHGYWTDELDRTTKKQHPTFPADAPIGENGETGAMYDTMCLLNGWFRREGDGFLKAELDRDLCLLIVPEYAALSTWFPSDENWSLDHEIPRAGRDVLEPATMTFNRHGVNYEMGELSALSVQELLDRGTVALHLGFFLGQGEQEKLVAFVKQGGRLVCSGELPELDGDMTPCRTLADFLETGPDNVWHHEGNLFADEAALLAALDQAGWQRRIVCSPGLRTFVYRHDDDFYVFFFNFDRARSHDKFVEFNGRRLELTVGSKTCGVVHVRGQHLISYLVKGENEFEGETAEVRLGLGEQVIRFTGDRADYDL